MNKLTKLVMSATLAGFASSAAAFDLPACPDMCLKPYVGGDIQLRTLQYGRDNGGNLFGKSFSQLNGYLGLELNEYVALELGYEYAFSRKRNVRIGPGQTAVGGDPVGAGGFEDSTAKVGLQGVHGSLVGKFPIWDCPNLKLLATAGVTSLSVNLSNTPFADDFGPLSGERDRTFRQEKLVARLGLGLQHMVTDCIGIRGLVVWEDTSQFKHMRPTQPNIDPSTFARLRSSFNYSLGLFMMF